MMSIYRISAKMPKLIHAGRFRRIDEWADKRISESGATTIYAVPRLSGLKYRPESSKSPLGGRIDPHLRHIEDAEALERMARADRFLIETSVPEVEHSASAPPTSSNTDPPSDQDHLASIDSASRPA